MKFLRNEGIHNNNLMGIFGIYTKNQVSKKLIKNFQKISHFEKISFGQK